MQTVTFSYSLQNVTLQSPVAKCNVHYFFSVTVTPHWPLWHGDRITQNESSNYSSFWGRNHWCVSVWSQCFLEPQDWPFKTMTSLMKLILANQRKYFPAWALIGQKMLLSMPSFAWNDQASNCDVRLQGRCVANGLDRKYWWRIPRNKREREWKIHAKEKCCVVINEPSFTINGLVKNRNTNTLLHSSQYTQVM